MDNTMFKTENEHHRREIEKESVHYCDSTADCIWESPFLACEASQAFATADFGSTPSDCFRFSILEVASALLWYVSKAG
jgi:hypothetical protein